MGNHTCMCGFKCMVVFYIILGSIEARFFLKDECVCVLDIKFDNCIQKNQKRDDRLLICEFRQSLGLSVG